MRTFFRWLVRIAVTVFILAIVLLVVAVLLKDTIAKNLVERELRDSTGMDAKISQLEIGIATPTVNLEGLKLYNAPDFGGGTFLEMPELRVEYLPEDVRAGKLRFKTVRLHIAEVHVVKNRQGRTNIEMMQQASKKKPKDDRDTPGIDFGGIDTLYLTVGKVRITDHSDPRNNDVIDVGIKDAMGRNLKTEAEVTQWFASVLLRKALADAVSGTRETRAERWQRLLKVFGVKF
jgi:uncharacterized protein involved in outer membrane biogenesis